MTVRPQRLRGGHVTSLDGTRITYLNLGQGPRLVFLHGGLGMGLYWMGVASLLAERYEMILVDRRGHGTSDWGAGPYAIEREVEDVFAVIDRVGPIQALVGHSYGATVAMRATQIDQGETIPSLILYEPALAIGGSVIDDDDLSQYKAALDRGAYEEALLTFMASPAGAASPEERAHLQNSPGWPNLVAVATTIPHTVAAVHQLTDPSFFRDIRLPVALLVGSKSPEHPVRNAAVELANNLACAQIVSLKGQGHHALLGAPALVADAIESFLTSKAVAETLSTQPAPSAG